MQFLKKSTLSVVYTLFVSSLFAFGLGFGLLHVFSNASSVKSALARSGIYQSVVSDALAQMQQDQQSGAGDQIPLNKPEVQNIIKTAASPELLQTKTENALDAVYAWLHGETPNLSFNLQVGDVKNNLADGLQQYVTQYVTSLPVCAPGAATNVANDPFNATCRPAGTDAAQVAATVKGNVVNGEFLKDTTISADSIKTGNGETLAQKVKDVPNVYQRVSWGVYSSGILALLLAGGVVLLSATWRSGLKKVSIVLIVLGALTAAVSWSVEFGLHRAVGAVSKPLQQSGIKVAEALAGELRNWWLWYGIALIVAGVATLVVLKVTHSSAAEESKKPNEPTGEDLPEPAAAPSAEPESPAAEKTPKPIKKLVQ